MLTSKGADFEKKGLKPDAPVTGAPIEAALKTLAGNALSGAREGGA